MPTSTPEDWGNSGKEVEEASRKEPPELGEEEVEDHHMEDFPEGTCPMDIQPHLAVEASRPLAFPELVLLADHRRRLHLQEEWT